MLLCSICVHGAYCLCVITKFGFWIRYKVTQTESKFPKLCCQQCPNFQEQSDSIFFFVVVFILFYWLKSSFLPGFNPRRRETVLYVKSTFPAWRRILKSKVLCSMPSNLQFIYEHLIPPALKESSPSAPSSPRLLWLFLVDTYWEFSSHRWLRLISFEYFAS